MKILVPVKRVIDYNVKIRVNDDRTGVETENVKMTMNPFDEIAVEEAITLRESGVANEVVVVTIGSSASEAELRHGLAMGADRGVLVESASVLEPLAIAKLLCALVKQEQPGLVIMGKQAIDDDCNQTGQMLAALLGWPQATFASKVDVVGKQVRVAREVDGGIQNVSFALPGIVTTDLRLNTPRFCSLPNLMKAKRKTLDRLEAASFGMDLSPRHRVLSVTRPAVKEKGEIVPTVDVLAERLKSHRASW